MKIIRPRLKLYRKLRYRHGYGVHSPFVYNLINNVIEEKHPFYAFEDIERIRKEILQTNKCLAKQINKMTQHRRYGELLFRMVNYFRPVTVLQVGGSTGLMSLYLSMASPSTHCYVLDESGLTELINPFKEKHKLSNLHFLEGSYQQSIADLKNKLRTIDVIFVNVGQDAGRTKEIYQQIKPFIAEETIVIIDAIRSRREMKSFWKELKKDTEVSVTMDLEVLGLVFYNKKLTKRHYKNYFNYGKKQSLYTNGRQRNHFFSWRKTSS